MCVLFPCLISAYSSFRVSASASFREIPCSSVAMLMCLLGLFPLLFFCLFPCFSVFIRGYAYVSSWPISVAMLMRLLGPISVFFRVHPWQMLLLLLGFPSVFVCGKLSFLIVFISVKFCFNWWLTSASAFASYRGLFFWCPSSILPVFIKNVQKWDVSGLCIIQNRVNRASIPLF